MTNMYRPDADGGYPADVPDPGSERPPKRRLRWGAGIILAGFLVGGGITLAVVSAGGTATASPVSSTQGAQLNTALSDAASSSAVPAARVRWALGRIRRFGGVEGTATFRNKKGFHTLSFERGSIQSVSGGDVVIKSPDGTTWTWKIVSDTVIRKNGGKTTASALSAGETVFAGGPVVSGARDARLIIIRPTASAGTSGSQSAQTSLS
jgi:hypothetical protein